jgi:hypothetical protein
LTIVARYARARMEIEGLSLEELAEKVGASGKNWVFRLLSSDGDTQYAGTRIKDPLMRLIDWIGFGEGLVCGGAEPGKDNDTYWGDVRWAIIHCVDIPQEVRWQLWEVVQAWARTTDYYEAKLKTTIEVMRTDEE